MESLNNARTRNFGPQIQVRLFSSSPSGSLSPSPGFSGSARSGRALNFLSHSPSLPSKLRRLIATRPEIELLQVKNLTPPNRNTPCHALKSASRLILSGKSIIQPPSCSPAARILASFAAPSATRYNRNRSFSIFPWPVRRFLARPARGSSCQPTLSRSSCRTDCLPEKYGS